MKERLVDVKMGERLLHTFPVSISGPLAETGDEAFKKKALDAAANSQLVADTELAGLSATMHVSHGGPLEPDNDGLSVLAETKAGLDQVVRERAYALREHAGQPDGRGDEFWHQAQQERWRERAYALWERDGGPAAHADEHWNSIRDFEKTDDVPR